jgi:CBS-domain-containing membrane protein
MPFKRVGDIMIPLDEYPHLPHWFTLRQALAELKGAQYKVGGQVASPRSALVFDEAYRLLGQLRRRDILRGIEPRYLSNDKLHIKFQDIEVRPDPDLWELSFDKTIKALRERSERKISEVMQPIVTTLEFEDPLMKAVFGFVEHDLSLIPVMRDDKVVGVVNTVGLFHELQQLILE